LAHAVFGAEAMTHPAANDEFTVGPDMRAYRRERRRLWWLRLIKWRTKVPPKPRL
jgi:hypothetical protein